MSTFPDGETKRALLRVQKKRSLKSVGGGFDTSAPSSGRNSPSVGADDVRAKKKRRT